jgi:hypothetical protein
MIAKIYLCAAALCLTSCAAIPWMQKPTVDSQKVYALDGFQFQFAMDGPWLVADISPGFMMVGTKPNDEKSTKLAAVRFGPMATPGNAPKTNAELIEVFKYKVEAEAKGPRMSHVKTKFKSVKYKQANCLSYEQTANDDAPTGPQDLSNDGMICIHPSRKMMFIWMVISERHAVGKSKLATDSDEQKFFGSLGFLP